MKNLPKSRTSEMLVQSLGKEVLIYDLVTHKAYNLNETSSIVYNACDGKTSFDELKRRSRFTDEIIFLALDELKKENLIEESKDYDSPLAGMSRREAIRKVGLASMIALPIITGLVAPTAAHAASSTPISRACVRTCVAPGINPCTVCGTNRGRITGLQFSSSDVTCPISEAFSGNISFNCADGGGTFRSDFYILNIM